jgi:carbon-monoxide dehydrogenase small subunit
MGSTRTVRVTVNGATYEAATDVRRSLLSFVRDTLGLTGTKEACAEGECGACSILLDGRLVASCLVFAVEAHGKTITTVEGLASNGEPHPLQKAFVAHGAVQCGFCIPGMLVAAKALLDRTPRPTEAGIRHAISGNLCRCTGYQKIVQAIGAAAARLAGAQGR